MSDAGESTSFGEQLLGIEGFSAERAKRYREEITQLLAHRISRMERWGLAVFGAVAAGSLVVGGISIAAVREGNTFAGFENVRWTFAVVLAATGVVLGGWLLWVALKGGYSRRAGDVIGPLIAFVFCGGSGVAFVEVAWSADDPALRAKMLFTGGLLLAVAGGCVLLAAVQRMHRQTQLKLLRIEYHVAELMERGDHR